MNDIAFFPGRLDRVRLPILVLLVVGIALVPLWSADIPPLLDYHNHLARQYIIARIGESQYLPQFYEVSWYASPYLALDAIVQGLATFLPVDVAGKLFLSLTLLSLAFAPLALNLALFGRVTPVALLGLLFVHNQTVTLGFLNHLLGIGLALCFLALWIGLRHGPVWVRLVVFPLLSSLLFFTHLIGFVIYVLTMGSYELGQHLKQVSRRGMRSIVSFDRQQQWNLLSLFLQCALPLAIFSALGPAAGNVTGNTYGGFERKVEHLLGMFHYLIPPYAWTLDHTVALAIPAAILLLMLLTRLVLPSAMAWPLGALLVLFFVMPMELFGGWGADHRLLPAIGLLLIGSLRPNEVKNPSFWSWMAVGIVALVALRMGTVSAEWRKADQEYAEYLEAFNSITDGSKMFYAFGHSGAQQIWPRPVYHLPLLVLSKRHVYVPFLFASKSGRMTLRYQSSLDYLQRLSPGPVLMYRRSPNWDAIVDQYDYFLLVNKQHFDIPVPTTLVPVFEGKTVTVYRAGKKSR